jgi:outer membrane immunogenic protein
VSPTFRVQPRRSQPFPRRRGIGGGIWAAFGIGVALCSGAPAARAADLPFAPASPAPPLFTWSGLYAGVQAGYAVSHDHLVERFTANGAPTGLVFDDRPDGFAGGGHVGANYQIGQAVIGAVADFEGTTARGTFADPTGIGRGADRLSWQGSVRGRLGYSLGPVLAYATGGFAYAGLQTTYVFVPTGATEVRSHVVTGWTVGGGLDYAVTDRWFVSAEYRHTEYDRLSNPSTIAFPGLTAIHALRSDEGTLGVSYRF